MPNSKPDGLARPNAKPDRAISAISKRLAVSKSNAARVVMTESAHFACEARHDCYKELGVERYQVVKPDGLARPNALDRVTCEVCGAMDGQVFPMSEYQPGATAPVFHPWCRCCTIPYFEDMAEIGERIARDADGKTYEVPRNMSYTEWRKKISSKGFTNAVESDIIIGRSVGAKALNYEILDLKTGEIFYFSEGSRIKNVKVFAGKGSKNVFRKADFYASRYGGSADEWQHVKGFGLLETDDGEREAEVHWVQCAGIGKFEFFVKEWLD